jgi:hypothetical protein
MYTALHFTVALKPDTPHQVIDVLHYMLDDTDHMAEPPLPDHDLFRRTIRWRHMLVCDSFSFEANTHSTMQRYPATAGWNLSITCCFKNYASELQLFLDWIMPYVYADPRDWLGYWMYEEDDEPTLIFYPSGGSS